MIAPHGASPMRSSREVTSIPTIERFQTSMSSGEHYVLSIPLIVVIFLDLDVKEGAKGRS